MKTFFGQKAKGCRPLEQRGNRGGRLEKTFKNPSENIVHHPHLSESDRGGLLHDVFTWVCVGFSQTRTVKNSSTKTFLPRPKTRSPAQSRKKPNNFFAPPAPSPPEARCVAHGVKRHEVLRELNSNPSPAHVCKVLSTAHFRSAPGGAPVGMVLHSGAKDFLTVAPKPSLRIRREALSFV